MHHFHPRFVPGGHESFGALFNTFVHVVMYTYYFLASLGPQYRRFIWWKKYLTHLQIAQFVVGFLKTLPNVMGWTDCGFPWQFSALTLIIFALMFIMFVQFYADEYIKKERKRKMI